MKHRLLLFDIDGTLVRTHGAGMRAMASVARQLFGDDFRWEGVQAGGNLDPMILAQAAAINGLTDHQDHEPVFREHYLKRLPHEIETGERPSEPTPGVLDLLAALRERAAAQDDIMLGLLTGNYSQAAPIKLKAVGIDPDWFTITAFGEEAPSRPDLVALAMKKYQAATGAPAAPDRVIIIGDTHRDIQCAKAHGCVAFAVATGPFNAAHLTAAKADIVVENLADPTPLLALLND